jgi:hypothetical protein
VSSWSEHPHSVSFGQSRKGDEERGVGRKKRKGRKRERSPATVKPCLRLPLQALPAEDGGLLP